MTHEDDQTDSETVVSREMSDAGFRAVADEIGAVLFYEDERGLLIEREDESKRWIVSDIRYMDDDDDGGLFVGVGATVAKALRTAKAWHATADLFPIPERRRAFEALMDGAAPVVGAV